MSGNLVLDASVVIKWYTHEALKEQAVTLRERVSSDAVSVGVPRFFFIEAANVLWKKVVLRGDLDRMDAKGIFSRILDLPFHVIEDDEILLKALELSTEHAMSIYDAMYVAGALRFKAVLVTADAVLTKKLAGSGLSHHVKYLGDL